jgi:nucleoside-diphosphate-sugar epimerase
MKIFVAGATGVVGRRAVVQLIAAGFDVTGLVRTARPRADLVAAGARPVEVNLFDHDAVVAAVAGHDAVVNLATAIPVGDATSDETAWATNHHIREAGSRNLVDGAIAAGSAHYVQESIAFLYADGGDVMVDESWPVEPTTITGSALTAEAEAARFAAHGGAGVALRFGQFYGYDSAHTIDAIEAVLAGRPAELGPETAYRSAITTDDAASAVVAAVAVPSGVYNVVDDEPLSRADNVDALAVALGVAPPSVPSLDVELPPAFSMMTRSQRVSNARLEAAAGWRPGAPSAREGWAAVVAEWRAHRAARVG